jgi:hypothetical protein
MNNRVLAALKIGLDMAQDTAETFRLSHWGQVRSAQQLRLDENVRKITYAIEEVEAYLKQGKANA